MIGIDCICTGVGALKSSREMLDSKYSGTLYGAKSWNEESGGGGSVPVTFIRYSFRSCSTLLESGGTGEDATCCRFRFLAFWSGARIVDLGGSG